MTSPPRFEVCSGNLVGKQETVSTEELEDFDSLADTSDDVLA
jgi:hypothetical protein